MLFFFSATAPANISTLSLHDALPIWPDHRLHALALDQLLHLGAGLRRHAPRCRSWSSRSEEHTSELQSRQYLVCRLLLEKKKQGDLCLVLYMALLLMMFIVARFLMCL